MPAWAGLIKANNVPGIVVSDYQWIEGFVRETTGESGGLNWIDTNGWIIEPGTQDRIPGSPMQIQNSIVTLNRTNRGLRI